MECSNRSTSNLSFAPRSQCPLSRWTAECGSSLSEVLPRPANDFGGEAFTRVVEM